MNAGGIGTKDVARIICPYLIGRDEMEKSACEANKADHSRPVGSDFKMYCFQ